MHHQRTAIIDIGSNSIRLVVYDGPVRSPAILFNEKVTAGLGMGLVETGALDGRAMAKTLRALDRFALLTRAMGVASVRTVATAAVREASNGKALLDQAKSHGLDVELLSGDAEAEAAGLGVVSAIPWADGIVGDLGGGSLELVRISEGKIHQRSSFPLGVLRLAALRAKGPGRLKRQVTKLLANTGWSESHANLPLYLVGGSWRALARLHMHLTEWPLPILHQYVMPPLAGARLVRVLAQIDRKRLKGIENLPAGRIPALADAAALLAILAAILKSNALVVSASGLREGLLYAALPESLRTLDPLIAAVREAGARQGRFSEHGDVLDRWIARMFAGETVAQARLRHAACLLGDVAWAANPEFRAERGMEIALHGNWVGVDAPGRAMIGQALHTSFGGSQPVSVIGQLISPEDQKRAIGWGLAMRLGQRLSGGVAGPLEQSELSLQGLNVALRLPGEMASLYGEVVERRHRQLATLTGGAAILV